MDRSTLRLQCDNYLGIGKGFLCVGVCMGACKHKCVLKYASQECIAELLAQFVPHTKLTLWYICNPRTQESEAGRQDPGQTELNRKTLSQHKHRNNTKRLGIWSFIPPYRSVCLLKKPWALKQAILVTKVRSSRGETNRKKGGEEKENERQVLKACISN